MSNNNSSKTVDTSNLLNDVKSLLDFCNNEENTLLRTKDRASYIQKCGSTFNTMTEKFPSLFYKIVEDPQNFEIERLLHLLNLKEKVSNNKISLRDASISIGNQYYNEFVKPHLDDSKEST